MKTVAYIDLQYKNRINYFNPDKKKEGFPYNLPIGFTSKNERIIQGLNELKNTGNIAIYLINGNKKRLLMIHK